MFAGIGLCVAMSYIVKEIHEYEYALFLTILQINKCFDSSVQFCYVVCVR